MNNIYIVLKEQIINHPLMEICDAIKLIYQAEFGGGYSVKDEYNCMKKIEDLGSNLSIQQLTDPYYEDIGGGYSRMNMSVLGALPVEVYGKMFMASTKDNRGTERGFETRINILRRICDEGVTSFSADALNRYMEEYRKDGVRPVSHSEIYTETYHPAYRVVRNEFCKYLDVFIKLSRIYSLGHEVTIAIDGPSYSGKTALAKLISTVFDCNIFDTRDFKLPGLGFQRSKGVVTNIDTKRLKTEVCDKLNTGEPFSYGIYDREADKISDRRAVPPKRLNIIKGGYSLHPLLRKYYELKIYMDIDPKLQIKKFLDYENPAKRLEAEALLNEYLENQNIKLICDLDYEEK